MPKIVDKTCLRCGDAFRGRPIAKYCGRACGWAATKGNEYMARVSRESATLRGDLQRGRGERRGYVKRNGRHEHREVAERMLGRPLRDDEIVHHVDEDKTNNDQSNLRVMTQAEHMREHNLGIPGVTLTWAPWSWQTSKTHCPSGHEYTESNTIRRACGSRVCKTCNQNRNIAWKAKRKAA